jgi:hypothetical protein
MHGNASFSVHKVITDNEDYLQPNALQFNLETIGFAVIVKIGGKVHANI